MKTNKEYLLELLQKETKLSFENVVNLFEIMNEYDWACFCSQMGDYDHPGERIQAKKVLDEKLKSYREEDWKKVWNLLEEDECCIRSFYNEYFHNMNDEFEE